MTHSPQSLDTREQRSPDDEVVQKPRLSARRPRKRLNCVPCRANKLKCDRHHPCSSCVLRDTTEWCYKTPGTAATDASADEHITNEANAVVRPFALSPMHSTSELLAEIAILRRSLDRIQQRLTSSSHAEAIYACKLPTADQRQCGAPGTQGQCDFEGLYSGSTSLAAFLNASALPEKSGIPGAVFSSILYSSSRTAWSNVLYDEDLLASLHSFQRIDYILAYYFEYCNWVYQPIDEAVFLAAWGRFKSGYCSDRIALATICGLAANALIYMPPENALLLGISESCIELGHHYFTIMETALTRHRESVSRVQIYSLELIEVLLARHHYLAVRMASVEELARTTGELVTIATALGLHRDPEENQLGHGDAQRRRRAWWNLMILDQWQALLFGLPPHIASHHFDTRLPTLNTSGNDQPWQDQSPEMTLFRLSHVLDDVMDAVLSTRRIPYSAVQERDKQLTDWYASVPQDICFDQKSLQEGLCSPSVPTRRAAVQGVVTRSLYLNVRLTLHRAYVAVPTSLEIAAITALELIDLISQPDVSALFSNHLHWGIMQIYLVAAFCSIQLTINPMQPESGLFRRGLDKAMRMLEQRETEAVAQKALAILRALAPLCSVDRPVDSPEKNARTKAEVWEAVQRLIFPRHRDMDPVLRDEPDSWSASLVFGLGELVQFFEFQ